MMVLVHEVYRKFALLKPATQNSINFYVQQIIKMSKDDFGTDITELTHIFMEFLFYNRGVSDIYAYNKVTGYDPESMFKKE